MMPDREKVIKGLEQCTKGNYCQGNRCPYFETPACDLTIKRDALALLKEQEHKDRMFHALEDDWKRMKELLKEQEAVEPVKIPWLRSDGSVSEKYRCGSCDLSIFPSYKYCPFCGQEVKWE